MADAAYTLFFVAVLLGSGSFLHVTVQRERHRILAALRGEPLDSMILPVTAGQISFAERPQPILQPVEISICRI